MNTIYRDPDGNTFVLTLPDPPQQPLDPTGALATLLAVTGTLTVEDAANSVHLEPAALVAEAEAWAVAAQTQ